MATHLFKGYDVGGEIVVTSQITLCCQSHSLGLPKSDSGTVNPDVADCPVPVVGEEKGEKK